MIYGLSGKSMGSGVVVDHSKANGLVKVFDLFLSTGGEKKNSMILQFFVLQNHGVC